MHLRSSVLWVIFSLHCRRTVANIFVLLLDSFRFSALLYGNDVYVTITGAKYGGRISKQGSPIRLQVFRCQWSISLGCFLLKVFNFKKEVSAKIKFNYICRRGMETPIASLTPHYLSVKMQILDWLVIKFSHQVPPPPLGWWIHWVSWCNVMVDNAFVKIPNQFCQNKLP